MSAVAELSFSNGCFFFLPYLALYALAWLAGIPVSTTTALFGVLHVLNLGLLVAYAARHRRDVRLADVLFWSALLLVFLLPGAYLEYPADPWEHFRRIYRWSNLETIDEHGHPHKFAYFWGHSLLQGVEPENRRLALGAYAAFWQMLVASQVYALARRLGFSRAWSWLQVVAFVVLFGTSVFGMRYYALSSTPLAYAAFLRALSSCIDFLDRGSARAAAAIPLLVVLAWGNHLQEVLFCVIGVGVLMGLSEYQSLDAARRRIAHLVLLAIVASGFAAGVATALFAAHLFEHIFDSGMPFFGGFAVWQRDAFLETYGVHGLLSIGLALVLRRRHPRLAALTLAPTLFLLFPPTALAFASLIPTGSVSFRVLYAFPLSFMLVAGLRDLSTRAVARLSLGPGTRRALPWAVTAMAVLALAAPPAYPWRGRLWFVFYQPPPERALEFLDETAAWLRDNRSLAPDCRILGDPATRWAVSTHLGLRPDGLRKNPRMYAQDTEDVERMLRLAKRYQACGFLVSIVEKLPLAPPPSPVILTSDHWDPRLADLRWLTASSFASAAEALLQLGWTRTPVPPFYLLYEPPLDPQRSGS